MTSHSWSLQLFQLHFYCKNISTFQVCCYLEDYEFQQDASVRLFLVRLSISVNFSLQTLNLLNRHKNTVIELVIGILRASAVPRWQTLQMRGFLTTRVLMDYRMWLWRGTSPIDSVISSNRTKSVDIYCIILWWQRKKSAVLIMSRWSVSGTSRVCRF